MADPTKAGMLCPTCRVDLVMADRQGVEIDYCPTCRGVWLDRGELDKIIERSSAYDEPQPQPQPQRQMVRESHHDDHGYRGDHGHRDSRDSRDSRDHRDSRDGYGHHGSHGHYGKKHRRKSFLQEILDF